MKSVELCHIFKKVFALLLLVLFTSLSVQAQTKSDTLRRPTGLSRVSDYLSVQRAEADTERSIESMQVPAHEVAPTEKNDSSIVDFSLYRLLPGIFLLVLYYYWRRRKSGRRNTDF